LVLPKNKFNYFYLKLIYIYIFESFLLNYVINNFLKIKKKYYFNIFFYKNILKNNYYYNINRACNAANYRNIYFFIE
jgi:hypothetical protein